MLRTLADVWKGSYPSKHKPNNSPIITHSKLSARRANFLAGILLEHPRLGNIVPNGLTSELWLLELDRNYARTFSRFYRLGQENVDS